MKISIKILLLIISVFIFSCEKQGLFVKCSDCTIEEPVKTELDINIDINNFGSGVLINVYEGNLEDSVLYTSYNASSTHTTVSVSLNKKYTVTATYFQSGDEYIAVDSAIPRIKYTKNQCDDPCYFVYDKFLNLRVKYIK